MVAILSIGILFVSGLHECIKCWRVWFPSPPPLLFPWFFARTSLAMTDYTTGIYIGLEHRTSKWSDFYFYYLHSIPLIIISSDQLSKTCGFPFKTAFNKFQSHLLVCPYRPIIVEYFKFFRIEDIPIIFIWRQLIISMDTTGLYPLRRFWMMDRSSLLASRMTILCIFKDLKLWLKFFDLSCG